MVEQLKKEFDIAENWISYELHPETPQQGMLLAERFPGFDVGGMYDHLRETGAPFGIHFGDVTILSNSRKALEASEYARDMGKYEIFHEKMFYAYFVKTRDIGQWDVIKDVADESGLDTSSLRDALDKGTYAPKLEKAQKEARKYDIEAVPTFIIEGKTVIVGAQSPDVFRKNIKEYIRFSAKCK